MQLQPARLVFSLSSFPQSSFYTPLLLDVELDGLFQAEEVSSSVLWPGLSCSCKPPGTFHTVDKDKVPLVSPSTIGALFVASLLFGVTYRKHSAMQPLNTQKEGEKARATVFSHIYYYGVSFFSHSQG